MQECSWLCLGLAMSCGTGLAAEGGDTRTDKAGDRPIVSLSAVETAIEDFLPEVEKLDQSFIRIRSGPTGKQIVAYYERIETPVRMTGENQYSVCVLFKHRASDTIYDLDFLLIGDPSSGLTVMMIEKHREGDRAEYRWAQDDDGTWSREDLE